MRSLSLCVALFVTSTLLVAQSPMRPTPNAKLPNVLVVDDFEDGDARNPRWWRFGDLKAAVAPITEDHVDYLGTKALKLEGISKDWVVGGVGTYFGINARKYNAIKLIVKGYGEKSGRLMIEIYDDDDGNYEVTPHPDFDYYIVNDDKFVYTLPVTWEGWKVIILTLDRFVDDNPMEGDNKWNPFTQENGGGGLTQMQFVVIAAEKGATAKMDIDTIKMFHYKGPKIKDERRDDARYFLF